jgi:predicted transcriptional regulator
VPADTDLLDLTAEIVAAHATHSPVDIDLLPELIRSVHRTLTSLALGQASVPAEQEQLEPAVPIQRSVAPDYVICLECGTRAVMLKRHLTNRHGLTPQAYRARWDLPCDYPLVAPSHAERRAASAKRIGLGRLGRAARALATPAR